MDGKGIYAKYEVRKKETGELVDDCFVLRPERDITFWLEYGVKGNKELYPDGGNCTYCDEFTDKLRPSPFMADTGADMCKYCWDSTKEEYANSNGDYIPSFEDYPHWKGDPK